MTTNTLEPQPRTSAARPAIGKQDTRRIIEHLVKAIDRSAQSDKPFYHLELSNLFPPDVYEQILACMPVKTDYRRMSGRTKSTRTMDGGGTRMKIDLFPEYIRHIAAEKRTVWEAVGAALCSKEVREAFRRQLAPGLQKRFGPGYTKVGMYPIPILTRDVAGYSIGVHPDTHWKGMTIQLYLPKDNSISHVGTVFNDRNPDGSFRKASQMSFSPNTGYAFAVDKDTWHSVETVGPEVQTRDSILLTYFVDKTALQIFRNRTKRIGNFFLNECRNLAR